MCRQVFLADKHNIMGIVLMLRGHYIRGAEFYTGLFIAIFFKYLSIETSLGLSNYLTSRLRVSRLPLFGLYAIYSTGIVGPGKIQNESVIHDC